MKRVSTIVLLLAIAIVFTPGDNLHAINSEKHYTVYYDGLVGPPDPDPDVMGEWDVDCEGNWTGWGWQPGHAWSRTEMTITGYCPQ